MNTEQGSDVRTDRGDDVPQPDGWLANVTDAEIEDVTKEAVAQLRAIVPTRRHHDHRPN